MSVDTCSRCQKPVYFAERKTSLGRQWHPNCLRCQQCGKILTPGQHAERKGVPFCHTPCYSALFGPQILGYGSNVHSSANFRKSSDLDTTNTNNNNKEEKREENTNFFFSVANLSPVPSRDQKKDPQGRLRSVLKNSSNGSINTQSVSSSGYQSGSSSRSGSVSTLDTVSESGSDAGLKLIYESSPNSRKTSSLEAQTKKSSGVSRSHSDVGKFTQVPDLNARRLRGAELFKKVQSYNEHHKTKRGQTLSLTEEEGNVRVQGPLRIYWGLKKPIVLKQYDEVPTRDLPKKRYSVINDTRDLKPLPELKQESDSGSPVRRTFTDDSVLSSPTSEVVMRRSNIKKSNTVAYRGDKPNKWKRASINGHIYNYDTGESMFDTSVFTPVLGSCTSVTVDNKMTVQQVVKALLEKFKVQNQPEEYNLCIVSESEEERVLKDSDIPLLERLMQGPTDTVKLFIRDQPDMVPVVMPTNIPEGSSPTTEVPVGETPLPEEVEQLVAIPEPVLRGLLEKFKGDEEKEVRRLKAKYDRIRRRVQQIIDDKKANVSRT